MSRKSVQDSNGHPFIQKNWAFMDTQVLSGTMGLVGAPARNVERAPANVTEAMEASLSSRGRRWFFRGVRMCLAGGLMYAAAILVQHQVTTVSSDQAYINGSITTLRAPIGGELDLQAWEPGAAARAGATLFRVANARFGNVEAMAQLTWINELVERLRVDCAEADLRFAKQMEMFKHHEALFQKGIVSQLAYLEEETKVELCRITMTHRKEQLRAAEARRAETERQVALQKEAVVTMPFDGVVWSVRGQNGNQVGAQESVIHVLDPKRVWVDAFLHEKHAGKLRVGSPVVVRAVDGTESWPGRVESIRAGAGRVDPEHCVALPAADLARRRIAVRVRLEAGNPFSASEFFGVGRSVKVTVANNESSNNSSNDYASARP